MTMVDTVVRGNSATSAQSLVEVQAEATFDSCTFTVSVQFVLHANLRSLLLHSCSTLTLAVCGYGVDS